MLIRVSLSRQTLSLVNDAGQTLRVYPVSTAQAGAGEEIGSYKTPRGRHIIRAKIGAGCPIFSVFSARRPTGEIWRPELEESRPGRDWILSRILWLSGCEAGFNRGMKEGVCVDSMRRYIYIHGCSEAKPFLGACSHGCIRMKNRDVIELFEATPPYTAVEISEG